MRWLTQARNSRSSPMLAVAAIVCVQLLAPAVATAAEQFLRVVANHDTRDGFCLDIYGHKSGVSLTSPLWVHTCKHRIWHRDGIFEVSDFARGALRMPEYDLCVQAESDRPGADLLLADCAAADLQTWQRNGSGNMVLQSKPGLCMTMGPGPSRDAGFGFVSRSVSLETCDAALAARQQGTFVTPDS